MGSIGGPGGSSGNGAVDGDDRETSLPPGLVGLRNVGERTRMHRRCMIGSRFPYVPLQLHLPDGGFVPWAHNMLCVIISDSECVPGS